MKNARRAQRLASLNTSKRVGVPVSAHKAMVMNICTHRVAQKRKRPQRQKQKQA